MTRTNPHGLPQPIQHPLKRINDLHAFLEVAAEAGGSSSLRRITSTGGGEWATPGAGQSFFRNQLRRLEAELRNVAQRFDRKLGRTPDDSYRKKRACTRCGWGTRPQAIYCDGCGALLSEQI